MRLALLFGFVFALASVALADPAAQSRTWEKLPTQRYPGKQDDIHFGSPSTGMYVNGEGRIYKTVDAGDTWVQVLHKPGTYFRCVVMLDSQTSLAGNIGVEYFPNVTDTTPLYRTEDGGASWHAVTIGGDPVTGLCALEVVREPVINAGKLDEKVVLVGTGRVGGPSTFVRSDDLGKTWTSRDLSGVAGMALDIHFFNRHVGLIAAASSSDLTQSRPRIIRTEDGGKTWNAVYEGDRTFETTWKMSFPTTDTGFVTIQSYNPDPAASKRFIGKTTDGGKSWTEMSLIDDHGVRPFGVAFITETEGWVGAAPNGFYTADAGTTWTPVRFGNAVNKIRVVKDEQVTRIFAIGVDLYRLTLNH
jgi:photosystem II stability/assembly factor-like uncharacterized protein